MKASIRILFLCGIIFFTAFSCKKENTPEWSDFVEGYIVGSFQCNDSLNLQYRGYCIIPVENNKEYMYTFSIQDDLIKFPLGIIFSGYDTSTGGPFFFPDSLRYSFKIRFKYRKPNSSEVVNCIIAYNTLGPTFPWEKWQQVVFSEVSKVSP